jgi:DNA invertase Pin-like site-specific DNA recombinase
MEKATHIRCPAMIEAGIADPESQEGKDFCTTRCPYDRCVVYEGIAKGSAKRAENRKIARSLRKAGASTREIARYLGVGERTVQKYLKE